MASELAGCSVELQLRFGTAVVGIAEDAFCSDRTWYAVFCPAPDMPPRVRGYITFCEDWHKRMRADRPHGTIEFDAWADVHASTEWQASIPNGQAWRIKGPVFMEGEVTWEVKPDAEQSSVSVPGS